MQENIEWSGEIVQQSICCGKSSNITLWEGVQDQCVGVGGGDRVSVGSDLFMTQV